MAFTKYLHEKQLPFLSLLVAGVLCIGIFLFAFGMSSYPSQFHADQIEATISKDETEHVKSHNRRPENSSNDLWHYSQQETQNKKDSMLEVKEPAETDKDVKKTVAEDTQKHNAKQVAEGTQKHNAKQVAEGTQKKDRKQATGEGVQKQQNMSIAFGKQDDSALKWDLCHGAPDFIPCLDNVKAIKKLASRRHMEHRERHCPTGEDLRRCLPPLPDGYRSHIHWPQSRDMVSLLLATMALTESMCWKLVLKTMDSTGIGIAIYQKPTSNSCYMQRKENDPPLCDDSDRPDAAWYVPLQRCLHKVPTINSIHGSVWPPKWPLRLEEEPFWLNSTQQSTDESARDFHKDTIYWRHAVQNQYLHGLGIDWSFIRNVMDMKSRYGGFAAALVDEPVWVMNVVPTDGPDTLPVIFDRGLVGVYHDWCESFNTYPRTYDLLHADHLFSNLAFKCNMVDIIVEMDRILRPQGWVIVHDTLPTVEKLLPVMRSLKWHTNTQITEENKQLIVAQKDRWRPEKGPHVLS